MHNLILCFPKRPFESSTFNKRTPWYSEGERGENYHKGPWAGMCKMGNTVDYQPMWMNMWKILLPSDPAQISWDENNIS